MKNKNTVNPKSLKGNDKLDRIKDLMNKMGTLNESTSRSELEFIKKGADNVIYGIVSEVISGILNSKPPYCGLAAIITQPLHGLL